MTRCKNIFLDFLCSCVNFEMYWSLFRGKQMARYQHLPIFKTSYDLLIEVMQLTKDFPREFKFSLGEKIQKSIIELLLDIYRANNSKDKTKYINSILEHLQCLDLLLRVSFDLKILSQPKYCAYIEKSSSIAKQSLGWLSVVD